MKRFLIALLIAVMTLATMMSTAEARRLGGGGSFGKSSSYSRQNSATPTPSQPSYAAPRPAAPAAAPGAAVPPKPASPWRGIVGGALAGLGIGALLSHFGMGGAMGGMLSSLLMLAVIAMVIMFVFRMFSRKSGPQAANEPFYPGGNSGQSSYGTTTPPAAPSAFSSYSSGTPEIGSGLPPQPSSGSSSLNAGFGSSGAPLPGGLPAVQLGIPADFDAAAFVRNAKSYFIRLQAAGDRGDIHDIREFTSPEMFAELKLQIQERGATPNVTDVVKLDGELLGIEQISDEYLATVRFTGLIKEAPDASAEPFVELWNFAKPVEGPGGWVLAGIQQAS
ncbi:Tim44 domain-containing protein [Oxalobacteraceae bacterium CAVE-383]|nr:Tim44 domain-containing protein [Oxalobacteraceae bacterium CAVE-383]